MDSSTEALGEIEAVATRAALDSGELLLSYLGRLDPARMGRKSSARDLVTEADVASERVLVERLRASFPSHSIQAEEEVRDAADPTRPRWYLDPLDGTVNFVHGLPAFCVSMGLFLGKEALVGIVHAPVLGETFVAHRGGGTHVIDRAGRRTPCRVRPTTSLGEAVVATGFPYRRNELSNNNLANFNAVYPRVRGIRRFGAAALDLAWVAAGRLDAFWEQHLGAHDVAAGIVLVREAGGVVRDLDGGDDQLESGHIVAGSKPLVDELASCVSSTG